VAICGSTLASQRVIDTILRAYGRYGASQGCASSFGWGKGGKDAQTGKVIPGWNYGESIGGGVGAGENYNGESAIHVSPGYLLTANHKESSLTYALQVHSTNTRQTDAEVIEKRTSVLVRKYEIRHGSGGRGRWHGGCGITREIEAREPLKFSILSDRRVYRPYGMNGGQPGARGHNVAYIFNEDGVLDLVNLGGKAIVNLKEGEYIQINTPGGGGYGFEQGEGEEASDASRDLHRGFV
jgi:5-oxoprolinase (ATP-hydrolysing)